MSSPLVSIIVPVYNASSYLDGCLRSLVSQSYSELEIILVDDGSTDNSGKICDKWVDSDCRIKALHVANGGVCAARNIGIEHASGDYVSFVDSDDWMEDRAYELLVKQALRTGADVLTCGYVEHYVDGDFGRSTFELGQDADSTLLNLLCFGPRGGNIFNYVLIRRDVLQEYNLRFPLGLKGGEDLWFAVHLYAHAKSVSGVAEPLYYYNLANTGSATHTESPVPQSSDYDFIMDCIRFLGDQGYGEQYIVPLYWRTILGKTAWVMDSSNYHLVRDVIPESNRFVDSCPFISRGMKLIMRLIIMKLDLFAVLFVKLYSVLRFFRKSS